jgi:hypothetical protein
MTTADIKIIVHPIAGFDFRILPNGVAVTIRYVDGVAAPTDQEELKEAIQTLTVGLTATQATELAHELRRAAEMIQSRTGPAN